jgi:ketosteroid isomerase-like protein
MKLSFSILPIALITGTIFFSACTEQPKPVASFDLASARKDIEAAVQSQLDFYVKGDSVGYASYYTMDAEFMESNTPVIVGRKNIESAISGFIKSGLGLGIKTTNVFGGETCLAEQGTYELHTKDGKQADIGKYIVLWKKEDGKWKAFRDIFNSDLPVPAK